MHPKKILIVDDDRIILKTLSTKLLSAGYTVVTAVDGSGAVSAVRQEKPDLILLDITFPPDVAHGGGVAWDAFLIMRWLRQIDEAKALPVVLITGRDVEAYKERAREAGALGLFHKSVDPEILLSAIQRVLNRPRKPQSESPGPAAAGQAQTQVTGPEAEAPVSAGATFTSLRMMSTDGSSGSDGEGTSRT